MKRKMFDSWFEVLEIRPSLWRRVVGSEGGRWIRDGAGAVEVSKKSFQRSRVIEKDMQEPHYAR